MPKQVARDKPLVTIVVIALAFLLAGFSGVWFYLQHAEQKQKEVRYVQLASVAISRDGHSMSASVAVRSSGADEEWMAQHRVALEQIVKQTLLAADPQRALAPGGLQALQESMKMASNAALHTDRVREMLVTDFLVSEGDL